jgi:putative ABC transport system permease protein
MDSLFADVLSGLRMLATYPALSVVAVITLGLGIGLSTTVFCVVNGGIFKGLPFPGGERIMALVSTTNSKQQPRQPVSAQDLAVFQERQTSFERIGALALTTLNLSNENGRPDRFSGAELTVGDGAAEAGGQRRAGESGGGGDRLAPRERVPSNGVIRRC